MDPVTLSLIEAILCLPPILVIGVWMRELRRANQQRIANGENGKVLRLILRDLVRELCILTIAATFLKLSIYYWWTIDPTAPTARELASSQNRLINIVALNIYAAADWLLRPR